MNKPEELGSKGVGTPATRPECPDESGEKRVPLLRYFVLLSALAALAGCKAMKHRKGFDQKQGGGIELHDPNAGMESAGSYLIDPSTGRIIFGKGAEKEKESASGEAASSKPESDKPESGKAGAPKPEEAVAGGNHPKPEEAVALKNTEKGGEKKHIKDPREEMADDLIEKALDHKRLIKSSDIVLPSRNVEREVKFSSSGREVAVHIKIPASHLIEVKKNLVEKMGDAFNFFFQDDGKYMDKETLRKRLLEADVNSWGEIGSSNVALNPDWPLAVSTNDPILIELTRAVTEKFETKRGKMQAINDFAVGAVKYVKDRKRTHCKPPLLTLADGMGDCKDFSVLVATMGKIVEVDCAFADFGPKPGGTEGHLDVACAVDGEGTAFKLDGKSYDWMNVTSFMSMYGIDKEEPRTNHDGIGVLSEFFGIPERIQPVSGKPASIKDLTDSGRLVLNEDRRNWEEKHSAARKKGK